MTRAELLAYVLGKPGAVEEFPFGEIPAVYKVMGKMFALVPTDEPLQMIVKCRPELAQILRQTYPAVTPAYHFNKTHWNGVLIDGSIADDELIEMIDHSYELVVKGLTRAQRTELAAIGKS